MHEWMHESSFREIEAVIEIQLVLVSSLNNMSNVLNVTYLRSKTLIQINNRKIYVKVFCPNSHELVIFFQPSNGADS